MLTRNHVRREIGLTAAALRLTALEDATDIARLTRELMWQVRRRPHYEAPMHAQADNVPAYYSREELAREKNLDDMRSRDIDDVV